jgi:hypothetical protein
MANCYFTITDDLLSQAQFQEKLPLESIDVDTFVLECLQAIKRFHLEIVEHDWNIHVNKEMIKLLLK